MIEFLLAFLLFSAFSYSYLRIGIRARLRGYTLVGTGTLLIGAMFLLFGFGTWLLSAIVGGIGFVTAQVGFGILMTRERAKDRLLMRRSRLLQRLTGRIPPDLVHELLAADSPTLEEATGRGWKSTLFVGVFSIAAGILLWWSRDEYAYPILLVASGAAFVGLAWRFKR